VSSRRTVLTLGLASAAAAAAAAVTSLELISRGILPGKSTLDTLDGACSVPAPAPEFAPPGPSFSRTFYSAARRRTVGYTIAYPPGHRPWSELPLVVMLHGYGGNHADALVGMSPAQAVALRVGGRPLAPMALVTVDGGNGYWNPHPDDDPMAMVIGELIPALPAPRPGTPAPADRHDGHLDGRLRCPAAGREVPAPHRRDGRDQPGHLDQLPAGAGVRPGRVRVGGRLRGQRRGYPCSGADPRPGSGRIRL
jgi:hypothetical protein